MKLKTGRPHREKADKEEQEAFKKVRREGRREGRALRQTAEDPLAFDEARFGLINWHRKRYGAPSHTSKEIELPENVSLLGLPSYSPLS